MTGLLPTYSRQPVSFVRGQGVWLWDDQGKQYFDALSGIAVCGLGHAHPVISAAIADQASTLIHTSNLYGVPLQQQLASLLCDLSAMSGCFFCNSGAEANEAALKLARLHAYRNGIENPKILVTEQSFHGRTLATLSATGNIKVQKGFEPLFPGFIRIPFGEPAAVKEALEQHPDIVAFLVEPIQGESGVREPQCGLAYYLESIRALCTEYDCLLMLDEIQTGNGRTGRYFAYQHSRILPDVVTTAKGLGNGFPIGAVLTRGRAADLFQPGTHGSTFGGTPLACRAALTTVRLLCDGVIENARTQGTRIRHELEKRLNPLHVSVCGLGMMIGVVLPRDATPLIALGREAGILFSVSSGNRIRLLPPLNLTPLESDLLVAKISQLVECFLTQDHSL